VKALYNLKLLTIGGVIFFSGHSSLAAAFLSHHTGVEKGAEHKFVNGAVNI
jgi:hypothetical protein